MFCFAFFVSVGEICSIKVYLFFVFFFVGEGPLPQFLTQGVPAWALPGAVSQDCRQVQVKVDTFSNNQGTMDLKGSGAETINCLGKTFTKNGQDPRQGYTK